MLKGASVQGGGPPLALSGFARGALTGALIGGILTTFDAFVVNGTLGAPLRRAPFAAHVVVKTVIYLGVILFGLKLGSFSFQRPARTALRAATCCFRSPPRSCLSSSST